MAPEQLEGEWTPADVESRARIVVQIGSLARESHNLVEQAKDCEVGIRNDAALRYGVPVTIWEAGAALADWVDSLPCLTPPGLKKIAKTPLSLKGRSDLRFLCIALERWALRLNVSKMYAYARQS